MNERVIQCDGYTMTIKGKTCAGALKDVRCKGCGHEYSAILGDGVAWESGRLRCPGCGKRTSHVALATGGTGSRYRYLDIGAATGHCRYEGLDPPQIEKMKRGDDGFLHGTGEWVDYEDPATEAKKAAAPDAKEARDERRKQINAGKRRARGSAPIFFDAKE